MNEGLRTCGKPSRGRYVQGCRCYMCRVANAEYALAQSHGENEPLMATPAQTSACRARVNKLTEGGWSLRQICEEAGVPRSSLRSLMRGHGNTPVSKRGACAGEKVTHKMSRDNCRAIMALPMRPRIADAALVDGMPLARGVKWALAHGHNCAAIARDAGIDKQAVYRLAHAEEAVTVRHCTMRRLAPVLLIYAQEEGIVPEKEEA